MKKFLIMLGVVVLLLSACGAKQDAQAEAVREKILALPTVEQFQQLDEQLQQEAYNQTQSMYEAYMALTQEQRSQIPEVEAVFEALFSYFNDQVMPLMETVPQTQAETEVPETTLPDVVILSEEEKQLLLKIGMAERGGTECPECVALVMCTVLNRVNTPGFPSSVRGVLYAQDQFTPVMDGSFSNAEPNELCSQALEMVIKGWDESQGALFYEWCEGESWHSKNLKLLFKHCDTRFYQ